MPGLTGSVEGLTHSPPLHAAAHLTGTVSGRRGLSFQRPLSTNKMADKETFFILFQLPLCLRLVYYIDLFRLTVILFGR